jgi:hypothetical protein
MKKRLAGVSLTLVFCSLGSLRAQDRAPSARFARRAESEKVRLATTPPMGWNSWDSYGTTIPEDEFKRNPQWLAQYLKAYGWQYVVVAWSLGQNGLVPAGVGQRFLATCEIEISTLNIGTDQLHAEPVA